jgi:hypothetical protein
VCVLVLAGGFALGAGQAQELKSPQAVSSADLKAAIDGLGNPITT